MMMIQEYKLHWSTFEMINNNTTQAFENMCRLLFQQQFLSKDTILNSKPNHPGIEVHPVEHSETGNIISFQSKYFKYRTDYSQIKSSMDQVIKHYSKELDIVYLYSNTEINQDAKSFIEIVESLEEHGITIELITNNAILDLIRDKPIIVTQFFNKNFLDKSWFVQQRKISLDIMEMRYNHLFNIETETENLFNHFLMNNQTVELVNKKIQHAVEELESLMYRIPEHNDFIKRIIYKIETFLVNEYNIVDCLEWKTIIDSTFKEDLLIIKKDIERINNESFEESNVEDREKIFYLNQLISFPKVLEIPEKERNLLLIKILVIKGEMGTGKSQLLSESLNQLINQNDYAILLPGHAFLGTDNIEKQVMNFLNLTFEFDELLHIFESIGKLHQKYVSIFIDAINESESAKIWKLGLQALIDKVNKFDNIRFAISVRSGFEDILFSTSLKENIEQKKVSIIEHQGFYNNSISAIKEFLNYYDIPFSPSYYFDSNMTNPLFLTIFCKIYDGNHVNFIELLKKYIEHVDLEAQVKTGNDGTIPVLESLINEIAAVHLKNDEFSINKEELLQLNFWNNYGLSNQKLLFISVLKSSGILLELPYQGRLYYRFGYNILEDFIYAKSIVDKYDNPHHLKEYLRNELLEIKDQEIKRLSTVNIFIITTALFKEKFKLECIDIIMDLKDEDLRNDILTSFIESFSLRNPELVDIEVFKKYISIANIHHDRVFEVLIENSTKITHDLNSDYLHKVLFNLSLAERDYAWTIYINNLNNNDRLIQLIEYYSTGYEKIKLASEKQVKLLITLFSWTLSSSNRFIRDKASKALIEILKENTNLCLPLLKKFEEINDPYIYQRIYAIIYGVCLKSKKIEEEKYSEIVSYIFVHFFNKNFVCPDILCRDYARQIIERYIYLYPDNNPEINLVKIRPPYKSVSIPSSLEDMNRDEFKSGTYLIASSMAPEKSEMMYGDFGRYEFQSALSNFKNVDMNHLYKYALEFIKEIGYDDDLFMEYDSSLHKRNYSRHNHQKTERIGKKYQWIAMYNILARVSDTHRLETYWDKKLIYNGPWIPYVRDFDPTLNMNNLEPKDIPLFNDVVCEENKFIENDYNDINIKKWTEKKDDLFEKSNNELLLKDDNNNEWIVLYEHKEFTKKDKYIHNDYRRRKNTQMIWTISQAYLVASEEFDSLNLHLGKKELSGRWFPEGHSSRYEFFNREYAWAPGLKDLVDEPWFEYIGDTGEFETKSIPSMDIDFNSDEGIIFKDIFEEKEMPIQRKFADVLPTYLHFLWEQQYDASQKESTSFTIPSPFLIDELGLEQKELDGYYYNNQNELIAFDRGLTKKGSGLIIRKSSLDRLLKEKDLKIFWTCIGEKQFIKGEMIDQEYSAWGGLHYLESNEILGNMLKY